MIPRDATEETPRDDKGAKRDAVPGSLDLVIDSWTPAVTNRAPKLTPIGPALSVALKFKPLLAPHPPTTFGADAIQDVGNHFCNRLEASQCEG
jgi:hypothetical protein